MPTEDMLVRQGRLTAEAIEGARARHPAVPIETALFDEGLIDEADWAEALAAQWKLPCLRVLEDAHLDPALVKDIPVDWARARTVLPVRHEGRVVVACADPSDLAAQEDLALLLGQDLPPVVAGRAAIQKAIERCYYRRDDSAQAFIRGMEAAPDAAAETAASATPGSDDLLRMADGAPVSQLVNLILLEAVKAKASDVHIEPFESRLRVRYRIDGLLYDQAAPPKHLEASLTSRLKVMAKMDIAEKRLPQDGMARVRVGAREIDVRVSAVPVAEGERLVLRLLNREDARFSLEALGMPPWVSEGFQQAVRDPQGIVLVTGPTGSGKTTTLYAALQVLDTRRLNIMTIEEPIEYQLPSISQMQVNPRIDLTFSRCLRHVLRQDPDVVLVGETRDLETAEIAIRASLTGHLVFTTLHTNDAASAPVRLADMGVPPYLLAAALKGVLAQRLLRRLCPVCRAQAVVSEADVQNGGEALRPLLGRPHAVARGCDACREGYAGRVGVYEWFAATEAVQEAIRVGGDARALQRLACADGGRRLVDDGLDKVARFETSLDELVRVLGRLDAPTAS